MNESANFIPEVMEISSDKTRQQDLFQNLGILGLKM